jgi:hypothetical protein
MKRIFCKNCVNEIADKDNGCLKCNSNVKAISLQFSESLALHDSTEGKVKNEQKKNKYHFKIGPNFFRKTKQWNFLERVIDWTNNLYKELIKDNDGNIITDVEEPLDKHQGHGSAKYKK